MNMAVGSSHPRVECSLHGGSAISRSGGDMKKIRLALAGLISLAVCAPATSSAQPRDAAPAGIPRTPDGKPDLNGIWQALEPANWDIRPHAARPAPLDILGASGA